MSDNRITIDRATWQRLQEDPSQLLEFRLGGEVVGAAVVHDLRAEQNASGGCVYSISIAQVVAMPDTDWRTASGQDLRDIAEAAGVDIMPGATDAELRRAFEALKELEAQDSAHPDIFCPWLRRPSWEERRPEDDDYILPNADLPGWEYMSTGEQHKEPT